MSPRSFRSEPDDDEDEEEGSYDTGDDRSDASLEEASGRSFLKRGDASPFLEDGEGGEGDEDANPVAWWELDLDEHAPSKVQRRCTNPGWCFAFVLGLSIAIYCMFAFFSHRQPLCALLNFTDKNGRICEPGYIFYCLVEPDRLDTEHAVCVEDCPNHSDPLPEGCPARSMAPLVVGEEFLPPPPKMSLPVAVSAATEAGYDSSGYGFQICRPVNRSSVLDKQMSHFVAVASGRWLAAMWFSNAGVLVSAAIFSVFSSYLMLYALAMNAECLIHVGIWLMGWLPLVCGIYLSRLLELVPLLRDAVALLPEPDRSKTAMVQAAAFIIFGLAFVGIGMLMSRSVSAAAKCLAMTYKCATQSRMVHHPLIYFLLNAFFTAFLFTGVAIIMVGRRAEQDRAKEHLLIGFFVLLWAWGTQAIFALTEFIGIYTTATWCFQGGFRESGVVSFRDFLHGHWVAVRYHSGTCAYGGLIISLARPVSMTLGSLLRFLDMRGNPLRRLIAGACDDCLQSFDRHVSMINKNAFNEVVLSGLPFNEAALKTQRTIHKNTAARGARSILNGATLIIQVCCVCANSAMAAAFVWNQVRDMEREKERLAMWLSGGFLGGFVTLPFVLFVDSMSDTILYCLEVMNEHERHRSRHLKKASSETTYTLPCMRWKGEAPSACSIL